MGFALVIIFVVPAVVQATGQESVSAVALAFAYVLGGAFVGAVGGLAWPLLGGSWLGAGLLGAVVGFPVSLVFGHLASDPSWLVSTIQSLVLGFPLGVFMRFLIKRDEVSTGRRPER